MYNRYIPQPDGTYQRNRMQDQARRQEPQKKAPCPPPQPACERGPSQETKSSPPCPQPRQPRPYRPQQKPHEPSFMGISSFLKQLLPRDFDTADLIVVLLLLLMSADSCDDQNNALLTLALYLFL